MATDPIPGGNTNLDKSLDLVLNALDRLMRMFRMERVLHLAMAVVGFLLLAYAASQIVTRSPDRDTTVLVSLFGSSGLITVSAGRVTYFFNKAFGLIQAMVIGKETRNEKPQGPDTR